MDRFARNFVIMSIFYLAVASVLGVMMLVEPRHLAFRFVHSHLMLLGWVSMMIYGVGYHILPKFAGKYLWSKAMAEAQFWGANIGLAGMLVFHTMGYYRPEEKSYAALAGFFGAVEAVSAVLFFVNMIATFYSKE